MIVLLEWTSPVSQTPLPPRPHQGHLCIESPLLQNIKDIRLITIIIMHLKMMKYPQHSIEALPSGDKFLDTRVTIGIVGTAFFRCTGNYPSSLGLVVFENDVHFSSSETC